MTLAQSFRMQNSIGSMSSQEIDVELFAFIERYATNLARWDLLLYFGRNPNVRGDAFDIAGRVGRKPITIQNELDDLTYLGVIDADRTNRTTQYFLSRDNSTRYAAMRMANNCPTGCWSTSFWDTKVGTSN